MMRKIHPDVIRLGVVSFLTDVSSEAIFSVFSIFFTTIIGASAALLGVVEGLADFSASSLDYVSGYLSDKTGRRKPIAVAGYGFSTLAKCFLVFANSLSLVALFRVIERLGKSMRGPARDAWIADVTTDGNRGYSFGAHKAMDKAGAVLGPLLAYLLFAAYGETADAFRILFICAALVAGVAVLTLLAVRERPGTPHERDNIFKSWRLLSPEFRRYLIPASLFALAYFSFGFLLLKAYQTGFSVADVILLYALFNVSFVVFSIPFGSLGDAYGRWKIISAGYLLYAVMSVGFVYATEPWQIIGLFIIFGAFYAIDEAQTKAFIADIERERRASAVGLYNFVTGIVYVPASVIAGVLWAWQSTYAFVFAAGVALLALCVFLALRRKIVVPALA